MTREKIYKSEEFIIHPEMPDMLMSEDAFCGNEDDGGYWNEYYRVGIIDDSDEANDQFDDFQNTAEDFYSLAEAKKLYDYYEKKVEVENLEAEVELYESEGMVVDDNLLRELESAKKELAGLERR